MAWVNPKYKQLIGQDPPGRATEAPEREAFQESGRRLATFDRSKRGGESAELRVNLDEYQGHAFISARTWTRGQDGRFYPTKAGVTVRVREIPDMIDALKAAERIAEQGAPAPPRPRHDNPDPRPAAPPAPSQPGFDEFGPDG